MFKILSLYRDQGKQQQKNNLVGDVQKPSQMNQQQKKTGKEMILLPELVRPLASTLP